MKPKPHELDPKQIALTREQVAEIMNCSLSTVDRMLRDGRLKQLQKFKGVRISAKSVRELLEDAA